MIQAVTEDSDFIIHLLSDKRKRKASGMFLGASFAFFGTFIFDLSGLLYAVDKLYLVGTSAVQEGNILCAL